MKVRNARRVSSLSHTKRTSKLPATVRDGKFQKRSTKGRLEDSIKELAMKGRAVDLIYNAAISGQPRPIKCEEDGSVLAGVSPNVSPAKPTCMDEAATGVTGNLVGAQDEPHQEQ